jgi:hypothetical protein
LARPLIRSPARAFTSGGMVGARNVSPTAKSPLNTSTQAIRRPGAAGSADSPKMAQATAQITPIAASARLRRSRLIRRSTTSWLATMMIVLSVMDSATTCTETRDSTVA